MPGVASQIHFAMAPKTKTRLWYKPINNLNHMIASIIFLRINNLVLLNILMFELHVQME